jgi:hypothetical protein
LQREAGKSSKTKEFGKRVDRAFSRASAKVEAAGQKVQQRLRQDGWDEEAERLIAYLNEEVVPSIRNRSSQALKVAAQKLARLAELLEERSA